MLASLLVFLAEGLVLAAIWWWDARARRMRLRRVTLRPTPGTV